MSIATGSVYGVKPTGPPVRAAIYARISSDPSGLALGVQRQIDDCRREAAQRGWLVAQVYTDNDVSATRSKRRPEYERMMADIRSGAVTGLIVWDVDRLTRTPRELEDIIDLAERTGLELASIGGGRYDLSTTEGRMNARMKGNIARYEAEHMADRLKRKFHEKAQLGEPHSFSAFGYRRDGKRDELEPAEAEIIRRAARQLLAGESLRSVVSEVNATGSRTPRGHAWSSATLRQVLLRDRNAGLRRHRGQVIGDGAWPAIYDAGTHARVVALLTDPSRRTNKGSTRRHLLTGIAMCGREGCDGTMVVNIGREVVSKRTGQIKRQPAAYVCQACTRVRRKQAAVDELVEAVMVARLSRPDALAAMAQGDPAALEAARAERDALKARMDLAADEYADGGITGEQLRRITDRLRPKLEAVERKIASQAGVGAVADMVGPDAGSRWAAASLDVRRTVIDVLCTVTILPAGSGRRFDPSSVRIEPR